MNLRQDIHNLLLESGTGKMTNNAYDTAWIARLVQLGQPVGEKALEWLRENQLADGSWGTKQPYYSHDRVICTLAAMNALARRGRVSDRNRLRRAEESLEKTTVDLKFDPAGETIGFELIVPTLLTEAQTLGGIHRDRVEILRQLTPHRAARMAALPNGIVNRFVTVAFSSEMAGPDGRYLLDVENLQEANGSVGHSPSATAYFALSVCRGDPAALDYLYNVVSFDGSAPNVAPFDVFEPAWVLWNLMLMDTWDNELLRLCQKHLDFLEAAWIPGKGIGHAASYTPKDGDDTSLVYEVLTHFGRGVDLDAVQSYEHVYYYRCFDLESNPSISTNVHVLGALRRAGLEIHHPSVQKVINFLRETCEKGMFWYDKWHTSPYYATSQAVIAAAGYVDKLVENAVNWIVQTQNTDGSWGYYIPTAEETAYCLQALSIWRRYGYSVPENSISKGAMWLAENKDMPYPPLWIGKCLYCPELVVQSAVLSALSLTQV